MIAKHEHERSTVRAEGRRKVVRPVIAGLEVRYTQDRREILGHGGSVDHGVGENGI